MTIEKQDRVHRLALRGRRYPAVNSKMAQKALDFRLAHPCGVPGAAEADEAYNSANVGPLGLVRVMMISQDLANLIDEPGGFRAVSFARASATSGHDRPPCRSAGYYRRGRYYAAFQAAYIAVIARPAIIIQLSQACYKQVRAIRYG